MTLCKGNNECIGCWHFLSICMIMGEEELFGSLVMQKKGGYLVTICRMEGNFLLVHFSVQFLVLFLQLIGKPQKLNARNKGPHTSTRARVTHIRAIDNGHGHCYVVAQLMKSIAVVLNFPSCKITLLQQQHTTFSCGCNTLASIVYVTHILFANFPMPCIQQVHVHVCTVILEIFVLLIFETLVFVVIY